MINLRQRWSFILVVLLVIIYLAIFYFQNKVSPSNIVEIYFADRITIAHRELIDRYNEKMLGKVKVVPIDFPNVDFSTNERKEVLARSLRGTGDGIDLFAVDIIWVQRFAKWCEPLDDYFSEAEKNRIIPQALASCYFEGELVAVPLNMVQGVLYYRDDILKSLNNSEEIISKIKNGISWEEFIKLKSKINLPNPFFIFPAADYEGFICVFVEILLSRNPNYFQKYGFNLDTQDAAESLQLLVDFIYKYQMTPQIVSNFTEVTSYEYFIQNDGLFIRGWPSYDKDFEETPVDPKKENNLRKAPIPWFRNGTKASTLGGWNLMVSKFSDKKKETIDFMKFLMSDESQEIFYRESGYYPIAQKFFNSSEYLAKYPEMIQMRDFIKSAVNRPFNEEYTRYSKIMSYYLEQAIKNQISVKEALAKATNAIQLEKNVVKEF